MAQGQYAMAHKFRYGTAATHIKKRESSFPKPYYVVFSKLRQRSAFKEDPEIHAHDLFFAPVAVTLSYREPSNVLHVTPDLIQEQVLIHRRRLST